MKKLRILFMGTPDFAVGILKEIIEKNYEVVAVITAPDKPAGRGQKVSESAVKKFALSQNLPVLQPKNLKDEHFLEQLKSYNANLNIVVAFRMLPEVVWKMPELGTFNLHASMLPDYRGAAPINWAIINGEEKTGVTTFFIDDKIDTGAIILRKETQISEDETAGHLHDRLIELGAEAVIETLIKIENGDITTITQPEIVSKTAYKLNRENSRIDWNNSTNDIYNQIRGLSPYPSAWTLFKEDTNEWNVKILNSSKELTKHLDTPGKIITDNKTYLKIATKDGYIHISFLQFPGKKPMNIKDFMNGSKLSEATICV